MVGSLAFLVTEDNPVIKAPEQAGIFVKFRLTFVFLKYGFNYWKKPAALLPPECKLPTDVPVADELN